MQGQQGQSQTQMGSHSITWTVPDEAAKNMLKAYSTKNLQHNMILVRANLTHAKMNVALSIVIFTGMMNHSLSLCYDPFKSTAG